MSVLAIFGLGPTELIIILAIILLLFGGSRLAGIGKSSGRALREFKEETSALKNSEAEKEATDESAKAEPEKAQPSLESSAPAEKVEPEVVDAEVVEDQAAQSRNDG